MLEVSFRKIRHDFLGEARFIVEGICLLVWFLMQFIKICWRQISSRYNIWYNELFLYLSLFLFYSLLNFASLIFSSDSLTGGSVVGDIAPYQAFAIGGLGSVRGYGEGAVGTGRSCLVANSELILPLVCSNCIPLVNIKFWYYNPCFPKIFYCLI